MKTTGKAELVTIIAEKTGFTKKDATQFIDAFLQTVEEKLAEGERVQLVGFGTFMAREKESRQGRNPATGQKIEIPAMTVPVFKPGTGLKNKVNGN